MLNVGSLTKEKLVADAYANVLQVDFQRYVRGDITEQEWIHREALVVIEIVKRPIATAQVVTAL